MLKRFALVFLLPVAAAAQTPPPASASPVRALRHYCSPNSYPQNAAMDGAEGETELGFHIESDGTVKDITVLQSSGSDELDKAAMSCVSSWVYRPATKNGRPIEVPWKTIVNWAISLGPNSGHAPKPTGSAHLCPERPRDPDSTAVPGTVVLTYAVDPEGNVANISVQDSSGDKSFDSYAASCISSWHFIPTKLNSVPIQVYKQARFSWGVTPQDAAALPSGK
jgi:TonB family protein